MEDSSIHSHRWSLVYRAGGIACIIAAILIIIDIIISLAYGISSNSTSETAAVWFGLLRDNVMMGLYGLDFLNLIYQIVFIFIFFAIYAAHRHSKTGGDAHLSIILFVVGTAVYLSCNTALPMLDLSWKYANALSETQKLTYLAAGEAVIAKGATGSAGALVGIILPAIAGMLISRVMFKGGVFNKITSVSGYAGNLLIIIYIFIATLFPHYGQIATIVSASGLFLIVLWVFATGRKLFKLTLHKK